MQFSGQVALVVGGEGKLDVELYSPESGCNHLLKSVPAQISEFWRPILAYIDNKILACGGSEGHKYCWSYDVANNNWLSLTESLYTHDYRPGMFQSSVKMKNIYTHLFALLQARFANWALHF